MRGKSGLRRRSVAWSLALLLGLMLLLTVGFMFLEIGHDCTGEHCSICHQIGWLRVLLTSMTLLSLPEMLARSLRVCLLGRPCPGRRAAYAGTPVSLHTRMND